MNTTRKTSAIFAKVALLLCVAAFGSLLMNGVLAPGSAQSPEERGLDDRIPKHLPIKVKIKKEKEKAFKDLKNKHWLRDLELEVTNTGNKPIYYLLIVIDMPEIKAPDGNIMGYPLHYGRSWDFSVLPKPDEVPLKPGETYVFKVPSLWVKGWETDESRPQPKKVEVIFQGLNFGDGTGFEGSEGSPHPRPRKAHGNTSRYGPESNDPPNDLAPNPGPIAPDQSLEMSYSNGLPAKSCWQLFYLRNLLAPHPASQIFRQTFVALARLALFLKELRHVATAPIPIFLPVLTTSQTTRLLTIATIRMGHVSQLVG